MHLRSADSDLSADPSFKQAAAKLQPNALAPISNHAADRAQPPPRCGRLGAPLALAPPAVSSRGFASQAGTLGFFSNVLDGALNVKSAQFQESQAHMAKLTAELRERVARTRQGGGETARKRHESRGKMLVRDRIDSLLDAGSPFLELSSLAAYNVYGGSSTCRAPASSRASAASPASSA